MPESHRARRARRLEAAGHVVDYLLLEEAAAVARTPVPTLRQWIAEGRLAAFRPGKRVLVRRADLDALITSAPIGGGRHAGR